MNNENTTIGVSTEQNIALVERPCGRKGFVSGKESCFGRNAGFLSRGSTNNSSITDEKLYHLCQTYGERTRFWRQKFTGLLPEVFKRRLYEKKGFSSIFEFSKKLAGLSEEQVRLVLNLEKRFSETPTLKSLLVEGKVSINKLARIVSIAKPENDMFLATQVQILSKSAVETLVRDEKFWAKSGDQKDGQNSFGNGDKNSGKNTAANLGDECQNGLQKSFFESKSLPGQDLVAGIGMGWHGGAMTGGAGSETLHLSSEVQQKLLELQQKDIDINNLLLEFLQKREQEIAERKETVSREILKREEENPATSHIPVAAKKILHEEFGKKCSVKNCQKPSTQIHHVQRFFASQSHDPRHLAPLCKEHHELAHSADVAYCEIKNRWK
ncbi:MAG: HNH endonuclease signature motif containing protein [Candidatus Gracilibacteria bacterium]|jgi:hypothetical protein